MQPPNILEGALYTTDLAAAERFYTRLLGQEPFVRDFERNVFYRCGRSVLLLFDPRSTRQGSDGPGGWIPPHGTEGEGHLAFAAPRADLPAWRDRLAEMGSAIESEVEWPQGGRSLYFRDPAGNSLEVASPAIWGLEEPAP